MSSLVKSLFPVVVPRQEAEGPFSSLKTMTLFDNLPSLQLCSLLHGTWLFESSRKDLTAPFLLPRSQMHFWELLCEFWIVILGTLGFLPGPKPRQLTDTLPHIPWARIPSTLRKAPISQPQPARNRYLKLGPVHGHARATGAAEPSEVVLGISPPDGLLQIPVHLNVAVRGGDGRFRARCTPASVRARPEEQGAGSQESGGFRSAISEWAAPGMPCGHPSPSPS